MELGARTGKAGDGGATIEAGQKKFCVLGTPDAADFISVRAMLAKEAEHADRPESIGVGHWAAEE